MSALRVVFAGTPAFGLPCLEAILNASHELVAVYTQPDRPTGRGQSMQYSPVKQWALDHQIPVYQPINFKQPETVEELAALKPDVMVVIAYGLLLPAPVLNTPLYGCINVHASLLPRWRGASPIQQVILHGDSETGVTIMKMDVGLDTGPMCAIARMPIANDDTSSRLHDHLAQIAVEPLLDTLAKLQRNEVEFTPQDDTQATYAPKIKKEDAFIDWSQSAEVIARQIRAYTPWPIARCRGHGELIHIHQAHVVLVDSALRTTFGDSLDEAAPGTVLRIDKQGMLVATGRDCLCVERVQFPGRKVMSVADWVNGGRAASFMNLVLE